MGFRIREAAAWTWDLRWPFLLSAFLLSPLLHDLHLGQAGGWRPDRLLLFAAPASILLLTTWHALFRRPWVAHALLFPFYITVAADLWVIRRYDTRLSASAITILLESLQDVPGYLALEGGRIAFASAALLAGYGFALWRMRSLTVRPRPAVAAVSAACVIVLFCAVRAWSSIFWCDVVSQDRGSPFGVLSQVWTAWQVHRDEAAYRARASGFRFGAHRDEVPEEPEAYVLVVGESSRPDHWGLYGYPRSTTPRLDQEPGLVVFRDAVAPMALTQVAVPFMLTRARAEDLAVPDMVLAGRPAARAASSAEGERAPPERSIVSAYAEAGFDTYWLSTQARELWLGPVNRHVGEASRRIFRDRDTDGALVEELRRALDEGLAARRTRFFLVLHTMGSHTRYASRVPPADVRFGAAHGAGLVDVYDDTVLYTDRVLAEAIETLRERVPISALLYVGDHGENLRDDARQLLGHFLNNEYDLPVPMVLWTSPGYARRWPAKVEAAKVNAARPLSTAVVFHTLADLAGIRVEGDRAATLSVLRPTLAPGPRLVHVADGLVDFDRSEPGLRHARLLEKRARVVHSAEVWRPP